MREGKAERRSFDQKGESGELPTLSVRRCLLLLGLLGLLQCGQLCVVHLLQSVPLLPVVQQAVQHGRDLHVETAEFLQELCKSGHKTDILD